MTEGHAQELKTQALALQVGKRLRILLSDNNAGIDDVAAGRRDRRQISTATTWSISGPPTAGMCSRSRMATITARSSPRFKTMEDWDPSDRRPMIVIGKTTKGYWPARGGRQDSRASATNWSAIKAIPTA